MYFITIIKYKLIFVVVYITLYSTYKHGCTLCCKSCLVLVIGQVTWAWSQAEPPTHPIRQQ